MLAAVANFNFLALAIDGKVDPQDVIHAITAAKLEMIKHFLALATMPKTSFIS